MRRRLEKRIYIPLPDEAARPALFRINLTGIEMSADLDLEVLSLLLQPYLPCRAYLSPAACQLCRLYYLCSVLSM